MILVAIGANLTDRGVPPWQTCESAAYHLTNVCGLQRAQVSRWYESAPMPPSGQPPYVNGVVRLEGEADPADLLDKLQSIETEHGRQRGIPNAARTLDLDILAMGDLVRTSPDPVLPHPRMHERAFVLRPLLDVAPGWRHPVLGLTVEELLGRLGPQQVRVLRPSHLRDAEAQPI